MARKKEPRELSEAMIVDIISTLDMTNDYKAVSKKTGLSEDQLHELVDNNRQAISNLYSKSSEVRMYAESIMKNAALAKIIETNKETYINSKDSLMVKIQMAKTMTINALVEKLTDVSKLSATDIVMILERLVKVEETLNGNATNTVDQRFMPMSLRAISNTTITETFIDVTATEVSTKHKK